jgi:hypothetical protein
MTYSDRYGTFFGRINDAGHVIVLHTEDGTQATQLDASVYPIDSELSARYEHANGIIISRKDADALGLEIED